MNIPEISNELKQGLRSESMVPAQSVDRSHIRNGSNRVAPDAIQKLSAAQGDKSSHNFSKEELNAIIEDAEKQLEKNDVKLKFNVLEENDTVQVEILDAEGKTIRKIPGDDLLKLSKSLKNLERGFLDKIS